MLRTILILAVADLVFGQGRECTISHTNERGVCRQLADCRHLAPTVMRRGPYTRCGFRGMNEIVCCPRVSQSERISVLKCRDYAKAVFRELRTYRGVKLVISQIDECGHQVISLIVGGELAKEKEFPHMALLGYGNSMYTSWFCGGSLISENFVLTAAHCTQRTVSIVRLGELNYSSTTDTAYTEDFGVAAIINHPQYKASSNYHDIALVRLNRNVTFSPYIRPACLPTGFGISQSNAIATGWGTTDFGGRFSSALQKVNLELFQHHECQKAYTSQFGDNSLIDGIRDAEQFCAGSRTERRDTCQGDSGGPLQVYRYTDYCTYTIIGVSSFGIVCGEVGVPGVYVRVFNYLDWIERIVWA